MIGRNKFLYLKKNPETNLKKFFYSFKYQTGKPPNLEIVCCIY